MVEKWAPTAQRSVHAASTSLSLAAPHPSGTAQGPECKWALGGDRRGLGRAAFNSRGSLGPSWSQPGSCGSFLRKYPQMRPFL